ncbi:universal stress family protein [Piscirickettsiaceae bacterium NZ-RLO2]|uniref:universal stress protein n=1 Tax=Piscirickettsia salmonis TaxID=1238 RepID=UPI000F09126D|nr:universal stress family protein [Piscirickettsiaceae bacterium NZ-RLO2]
MTKKYQHALFATDLGDGSSESIQQAQELSSQLSVKLSLLHVVPDISRTYGYMGVPVYDSELLKNATDEMTIICSKLNISEDNQHVVEGYPKEDILTFAKDERVDLIILNGHRHNWLGMLGSTADAIVNKAECDVFVLASGKK